MGVARRIARAVLVRRATAVVADMALGQLIGIILALPFFLLEFALFDVGGNAIDITRSSFMMLGYLLISWRAFTLGTSLFKQVVDLVVVDSITGLPVGRRIMLQRELAKFGPVVALGLLAIAMGAPFESGAVWIAVGFSTVVINSDRRAAWDYLVGTRLEAASWVPADPAADRAAG